MNKKYLTTVATAFLVLQGCASVNDYPIKANELEVQTYTYTDLSGSKLELWKSARNYLATAYGDSKSVLRVEDENQGTLIGKGLVKWRMLDSALSPYCHSEYDIRFVAKDHKARLQLELIPGAPALSECVAWTLPSKTGYTQILEQFNLISSGLESSLKGDGKLESMTDF